MEGLDPVAYGEFLGERRSRILELVAASCQRAGRQLADVSVMAVSKTVGPDEVALAMAAGYDLFGENRPQELVRKTSALRELAGLPTYRFDMIGNLQTNKINQVLGCAKLIHSVSSLHLAEAISKRSVARGKVSRVLLEANVSGEETKSGFGPTEVLDASGALMGLAGIAIEGVMTMAPAHDADAARRTFASIRELAEHLRAETGLALPVISCGMSDDFQIAIEEGSTLVRLGRTVFDPGYELR